MKLTISWLLQAVNLYNYRKRHWKFHLHHWFLQGSARHPFTFSAFRHSKRGSHTFISVSQSVCHRMGVTMLLPYIHWIPSQMLRSVPERCAVRTPMGVRVFLRLNPSRPHIGPSQSPLQLASGTCPGVKRQLLNAELSPLSSPEVVTQWSYTYLYTSTIPSRYVTRRPLPLYIYIYIYIYEKNIWAKEGRGNKGVEKTT